MENNKLDNWCRIQKSLFYTNKLLQERILLLDSIPGWTWNKKINLQWDQMYDKLNKYIKNNNKLPTRRDDTSLGNWISNQRSSYKKEILSQYRIDKLEKINIWKWYSNAARYASFWDQTYNILLEYIKENSKLPSKKENKLLGNWIANQRHLFRKDALSQHRIDRLEEIDIWEWNLDIYTWDQNYNKLRQFIGENNKLPSKKDNKLLASWVINQRKLHERGKLPQQQEEKLEEIDIWGWDIESYNWNWNFNEVLKFANKYKKIPKQRKKNESKLGNWCSEQRLEYIHNNLSIYQIDSLESIPYWRWNSFTYWKDNYDRLEYFVKRYKKAPLSIKKYDQRVYTWINNQISYYHNRTLSDKKINMLSIIPNWKWNYKPNSWDDKFTILKEFVSEYFYIPQFDYIYNEKITGYKNINIGGWCSKQKKKYLNGKLRKHRIKKMNKIPGWYWYN